jgi:hypothetical protein
MPNDADRRAAPGRRKEQRNEPRAESRRAALGCHEPPAPGKKIDIIAVPKRTVGGIELETLEAPDCLHVERRWRHRHRHGNAGRGWLTMAWKMPQRM